MLKLQAILTPILLVALFITPFLGVHQPVEAQAPAKLGEVLGEVVERREEHSKTYALGNNLYEMVMGGGIQHWKYDYEDSGEQWKEVDLTWEGPYLGTAPYEVWVDGEKVTFRNRRTGEVTTIERISKPKGASYAVVPFDTGIALQHRLANLNVPFEAQFRIEGNALVTTRAWDDEGELELDVTFKDGILTERLSVARDAETGQVRQTKGLIRIDPTLTIQGTWLSTPDTAKDTHIISQDGVTNRSGGWAVTRYIKSEWDWRIQRSLLSFDIYLAGLPTYPDVWLESATLDLYVKDETVDGLNITMYKLTRTDWLEGIVESPSTEGATWNSYRVDAGPTHRAWTTAGGDYDASINSTAVSPASVNTTMSWDVLNIVREAYDDDRTVEMLVRLTDETVDGVIRFWGRRTDLEENRPKRPKLIIVYREPVIPTLTTVSATNVTYEVATLTGNITDGDGTITQRGFQYGTVNGTATWSTSESGSYSTGVYSLNATSLAGSTTYYYRAYATSVYGTGYGAWLSFTTATTPPEVTTRRATYIGIASARLNAYVEYGSSAPPTELRFQYNTSGNFSAAVNTTAWVDGFYSGYAHHAVVTGLTLNTTYHFRVQARVGADTWDFTSMNFTTLAAMVAPSDVSIYTEEDRIVLTWTRGAGTEGTEIRFSTTNYPANTAAGTLLDQTALGAITHTGLSYGTTYYYTLWGYSGTTYTTSINARITTGAGSATVGVTAPTTPALWFTSADYTRFAAMPLYTQVNDFADSLSIPYATLWILGAIGLCVLISLGVLMKTHRPAVALIVMGGLMIVMVLLNLVPGWMIAFIVLFFLGASKMASGSLGGAR